jgi:hypothetical protein
MAERHTSELSGARLHVSELLMACDNMYEYCPHTCPHAWECETCVRSVRDQ